jgi:hypothetical protein
LPDDFFFIFCNSDMEKDDRGVLVVLTRAHPAGRSVRVICHDHTLPENLDIGLRYNVNFLGIVRGKNTGTGLVLNCWPLYGKELV